MKKTILIAAATLFSLATFAQGEKKENRVRIVTIENGKKKVIEKDFTDENDLAEEIKIIEDTLHSKAGKNRTITVDVRKIRGLHEGPIIEDFKGPEKELRVFRFKGEEGDRDIVRMRPGFPLPPKRLKEQMSETVKGLHIRPNTPFNGKFNVHFNAPEKGNVSISVTDLNGKELASEQIKDFQGDYLGQIDIKKSAKGVYFIRVTQGNDGAVRRVKVD